jgi:hypothetical protein
MNMSWFNFSSNTLLMSLRVIRWIFKRVTYEYTPTALHMLQCVPFNGNQEDVSQAPE